LLIDFIGNFKNAYKIGVLGTNETEGMPELPGQRGQEERGAQSSAGLCGGLLWRMIAFSGSDLIHRIAHLNLDLVETLGCRSALGIVAKIVLCSKLVADAAIRRAERF
jgi:hypothetical protein